MVVEALGQRRWATELFVFTDAKSITPDLVNGAARINVGNAHLEVSAPVEVERTADFGVWDAHVSVLTEVVTRSTAAFRFQTSSSVFALWVFKWAARFIAFSCMFTLVAERRHVEWWVRQTAMKGSLVASSVVIETVFEVRLITAIPFVRNTAVVEGVVTEVVEGVAAPLRKRALPVLSLTVDVSKIAAWEPRWVAALSGTAPEVAIVNVTAMDGFISSIRTSERHASVSGVTVVVVLFAAAEWVSIERLVKDAAQSKEVVPFSREIAAVISKAAGLRERRVVQSFQDFSNHVQIAAVVVMAFSITVELIFLTAPVIAVEVIGVSRSQSSWVVVVAGVAFNLSVVGAAVKVEHTGVKSGAVSVAR